MLREFLVWLTLAPTRDDRQFLHTALPITSHNLTGEVCLWSLAQYFLILVHTAHTIHYGELGLGGKLQFLFLCFSVSIQRWPGQEEKGWRLPRKMRLALISLINKTQICTRMADKLLTDEMLLQSTCSSCRLASCVELCFVIRTSVQYF